MKGETTMKENPLRKLQAFGQSIWLDYIRRDLIASGELRRVIEADGLRGITSNPSIFEQAIAGSHDCREDIRAMALEGQGAMKIYEALVLLDVQSATDASRVDVRVMPTDEELMIAKAVSRITS
jgi:transaldolase